MKAGNLKNGTRLGTQMRGKLSATYNKRGKARADLVLHYSFKSKADVVLLGEPQFLHFLHAESDPNVESMNYEPARVVGEAVGNEYVKLVHAVGTLNTGETFWRRVVTSLPDSAMLAANLPAAMASGAGSEAAQFEVLSLDELTANPMRLRNSLRAMRWIAAAKDWPLAEHKLQIRALIQRRAATFEEILSLGEGPEQALYGAAALEMAFRGAVQHDLFQLPLTAVSSFFPRRT